MARFRYYLESIRPREAVDCHCTALSELRVVFHHTVIVVGTESIDNSCTFEGGTEMQKASIPHTFDTNSMKQLQHWLISIG